MGKCRTTNFVPPVAPHNGFVGGRVNPNLEIRPVQWLFGRSRLGLGGKVKNCMQNHDSSTVLLVEDDLNDIFLVKRAFKRANIPNPLQVVTDGADAIHYLLGEGKYCDRAQFPLPRLIVMDIKMPRKSGFEVLQWIKRDGILKRIPVVIVSSSEQPDDVNRAYELGANAYMIKPVNFKAVENLFASITHYWGLECAKPELEEAGHIEQ